MLWNAKCSVVAQPTFIIKVHTLNQITFFDSKRKKADYMLLATQSLDDQAADMLGLFSKTTTNMIIQQLRFQQNHSNTLQNEKNNKKKLDHMETPLRLCSKKAIMVSSTLEFKALTIMDRECLVQHGMFV